MSKPKLTERKSFNKKLPHYQLQPNQRITVTNSSQSRSESKSFPKSCPSSKQKCNNCQQKWKKAEWSQFSSKKRRLHKTKPNTKRNFPKPKNASTSTKSKSNKSWTTWKSPTKLNSTAKSKSSNYKNPNPNSSMKSRWTNFSFKSWNKKESSTIRSMPCINTKMKQCKNN